MERNWQTHSLLTHFQNEGFGVDPKKNKLEGRVHMIGIKRFLLLPRKEQIDLLLYESSHRATVDAIIFYQKPDVFVIPIDDIKTSNMKKFETLSDFVDSYKNNFTLLKAA